MKKHLNLSITNPCSEKWDNLIPAQGGGFCTSCHKVVVDFTKMSDAEILDFFMNKQSHTCGRFRPEQLKSYAPRQSFSIRPGFSLTKAGLLSLLLLLVSRQGSAQNKNDNSKTQTVAVVPSYFEKDHVGEADHTVSGIVKDEYGDPMPGVNIVLKGSEIGTSTDAHGRFQFPKQLKEGDVLIVSFIGYETKEYTLPKKPTAGIELVMELTMDVTIMGGLSVDTVYEQDQSLWSKIKRIF